MPYQVAVSKPGSSFWPSAAAPGNWGMGLSEVRAMARMRSPASWGRAVLVWSNMASTWPEITSVMAGAAPL